MTKHHDTPNGGLPRAWLLIGLLVSTLIAIVGVASGGAGHGPYPELSLKIAKTGAGGAFVFMVSIIISTLRSAIARSPR